MKKLINIKKYFIFSLTILSIMIIVNCNLQSSETLEERANKLAAFDSEGKWSKSYEFYSPDFKKICKKNTFSLIMGETVLFMEGEFLFNWKSISFRVTDIQSNKNEGYVTQEMLLNGEPFGNLGAQKIKWIYKDNNWWLVPQKELTTDCSMR
ncbi:MAG: hypothetical protein CL758_08920 [Chloroflexi bacterium]|nr:hypothetical protein [Chloroflexota bacterium]